MALGTARVTLMMMTDRVLGSRCLRMMRPALAPMASAATTNSWFFKERHCPRTSRAMPVQPTVA